MNDVLHQKKKESVLKSLALLGFIGVIALVAWLSIQLINILPNAFSSLASLAESLNKYSVTTTLEEEEVQTLAVTSNTTLTNTGEPVTLSWGAANVPGSFTFSYQCTEGVAVDLLNIEGIKSITCGTNYNIGNVTSLSFSVDSEKQRYADLWYTISFLGTNDTVPRASGTAQLAVINGTIQNTPVIATASSSEEVAIIPVETTVAPAPVEETVSAEIPKEIPISKPTYEQEYTYTIPTSDPNGRVDLGTRFLDTGTIVNKTFATGVISQNKAGAIQFEVKNYGTKTSGLWSFTVTLPDGTTYESKDQIALKPNERAALTIGFPAAGVSTHTFIVKVYEKSDQYSLNDSFQKKVTFGY